jgi:hypothetical protein
MKKKREPVITRDKRALLIECGYKCSVPRCEIHWPILQFHHINGDRSDSALKNILVLCPTHHQMATSGDMDRPACESLKQILADFAAYLLPPQGQVRVQLLYSLAAELYVDTSMLRDPKFTRAGLNGKDAVVFPRLLRTVLDQAIASGAFIGEMDARLFKLLFSWSELLNDFNHRLDLTEQRTIAFPVGETERAIMYAKLVEGRVLASTKHACDELVRHLLENYQDESGVGADTVFFADRE